MKNNIAIAVLCLLVFSFSCSYSEDRTFRKSRLLMDTIITITVVSTSEEVAEKAIDSAFAEIARIEKIADFHSAHSETSLINRNAGISPVRVSQDMVELLSSATSISKETGGAFDITIGCISALYDFGKKIHPDDAIIESLLPLVDYRNITIDMETSRVFLKKRGMRIDPGGIAKGYAADAAVRLLKKRQVRAGLVSVAGDIKAFGLRPDGNLWKVGVRDPRANGDNNILGVISLKDSAVSTSGDYERFFVSGGVKYHHLLSPQTGRPAAECRSVTVVAPDSASADALATAVFILGPVKGMKLLSGAGLKGIIVDSGGKLHMTDGMKESLEYPKNL